MSNFVLLSRSINQILDSNNNSWLRNRIKSRLQDAPLHLRTISSTLESYDSQSDIDKAASRTRLMHELSRISLLMQDPLMEIAIFSILAIILISVAGLVSYIAAIVGMLLLTILCSSIYRKALYLAVVNIMDPETNLTQLTRIVEDSISDLKFGIDPENTLSDSKVILDILTN